MRRTAFFRTERKSKTAFRQNRFETLSDREVPTSCDLVALLTFSVDL